MRRTLYRKLILIYVILAIAGFTLISTVGSRMVEDSLVSSASTSLYREATQIASKQGDLYYHSERSLTDLYNSLSALASYHNSQIWLISADGEILLNTAAALDEENPEIIDGFDPVALGSEYYSTGTFFGYFEDKMLSVMVPVTSDFRINGYVAIHLPLQDVYQQRESLLARIDFLFLLVFGLSFVILIFFSLVVYRPLKKIINGAKEYASGNLTHKIDVKSHDEMGYLASTLNYMSGELNKTGEYQRKFVANVSHDFRSPLTSIKGYVEAILDGTIPPEMQEKYLKIVLFETERLHKLTQSLLTLNDIDDKGNMLDLTSFDINAVIKDTAASFEGTCTKKRISISLILASRTLYVCADMGKIQQVLYNLIDNAIKFSNNDSTITVETTEKHGKVFVSVKDTGCGIPKASITKIWERFYKLDASRGKDRKGTGLGLSIVKEIITAHNQNINVISTEGVGTEFIFTLAKGEAPKKAPPPRGFFARHIKLTLEVIFTMNPNTIDSIIKQLIASHTTISTMESCTSGLIASLITDTEGASAIFPGGYVTYLNETKVLVGVDPSVIEIHGVYSPECAEAMARTVQENLHTAIAIGITGTTGNLDPNNADSVQGVVYFCILYKTQAHTFTFQTNVSGMTRHEIKQLYAEQVFAELEMILTSSL